MGAVARLPVRYVDVLLAASRGHLDVLQLARAHGCPWGAARCSDAARGGHLAVLQLARAHGCPWN